MGTLPYFSFLVNSSFCYFVCEDVDIDFDIDFDIDIDFDFDMGNINGIYFRNY